MTQSKSNQAMIPFRERRKSFTSTRDAQISLFELRQILACANPGRLSGIARALNYQCSSRLWYIHKTSEVWTTVPAVIDRDGHQIAADASAWLREEGATTGAREVLAKTIKASGISFARSEKIVVYGIGIDASNPLDFDQAKFYIQTDRRCSLQTIEPWQLCGDADRYVFPWDDALRSTPRLVAEEVVNSLEWLEQCKLAHEVKAEAEIERLRSIAVREHLASGELSSPVPILDRHPELIEQCRRPSREQRWFCDWSRSSSGHLPLGRHWVLDTYDHVDRDGVRHRGFIPRPVVWPATKIRGGKGWRDALGYQLVRFDRRVKHEFGWFFHMVYGNRVSHLVGDDVASGISQGRMSLAVCDKAILEDWLACLYRF